MPNTPSGTLLVWIPRVLGLAMSLFIGIFALDALTPGQTFLQGAGAFLIHLTPAIALLLVVLLSWRWPLVGAVVFSGLAVLYAVWARNHLSWILAIAWPMLLIGLLFLLSWADSKRVGAAHT